MAQSPPAANPTNRTQFVSIGLVLLIVLSLALMHFVPLNGHISGARKTISDRLGVPVEISELRYALLPSPRLTLRGVTVGSQREIRIDAIVVRAGPLTLLADSKTLGDVEVRDLNADQDALALAARWAEPPAGSSALVRNLRLKAAKLVLREFEAPPFDGEITMGEDGVVQRLQLSSTGLRVDAARKDNTWHATMDGRNWQAPLGPALAFDDLNVVAVFGPQRVTLTTIGGKAKQGVIKGAAKATWADAIRVDGEFSFTGADLGPLVAAFTSDFSATGRVTTSATFVLQAASLKTLFSEPRIEAKFTVGPGTLINVDLARAIKSRSAVQGGRTRFESLTGELQVAGNRLAYRDLRLDSGPLNAAGNVDVAPNGELSGRVDTQLGTKTAVVSTDRLSVGGNVKAPILSFVQ